MNHHREETWPESIRTSEVKTRDLMMNWLLWLSNENGFHQLTEHYWEVCDLIGVGMALLEELTQKSV